jgi:hypothetical protein
VFHADVDAMVKGNLEAAKKQQAEQAILSCASLALGSL